MPVYRTPDRPFRFRSVVACGQIGMTIAALRRVAQPAQAGEGTLPDGTSGPTSLDQVDGRRPRQADVDRGERVDRQATDTVPQSGFYGDCRANKADVFVLAGADGRACQK